MEKMNNNTQKTFSEIINSNSPSSRNNKNSLRWKVDYQVSNSLRTVNNIVLAIDIIVVIVLFVMAIDNWSDRYAKELGWILFGVAVALLLFSLTQYFFLKLYAQNADNNQYLLTQIADDVRELKDKK